MPEPITQIIHLEDKVVIEYHLRKPWGESDSFGKKEVFYRDVPSLPHPPNIKENVTDAGWEELIDIKIPKIKKTICFHYDSERSGGGPPDESLNGPYLKS